MRMLLLAAAAALTLPAGAVLAQGGELRCPAADCPGPLIANPGTTIDDKTGRKFFLDMPKDWRKGDKVTLVLNLHGGGSYGNWQRHYFPIVDQKDRYKLVVAAPNAPPRVWRPEDDAHLQNVVEMMYAKVGPENVRGLWLTGHSQGGSTSRRIVCSPYFAPKVTGFVSLSGGRVGGQPERASGAGRPAQAGAVPDPPTRTAATPVQPAEPTCAFSHVYETGEHEIAGLPEASERAAMFGCKARARRKDIIDAAPGYIHDSTRQNPASKAWGRLPRGGTAQEWIWTGCQGGRVVADIVRLDKGHTEGLEPKVTEEIVRLMVSARG